METITIITDGDTIEVEAKGIKGKGCLKVTEELFKALGNKVTSTTKTTEFYQPEVLSGRKQGR